MGISFRTKPVTARGYRLCIYNAVYIIILIILLAYYMNDSIGLYMLKIRSK